MTDVRQGTLFGTEYVEGNPDHGMTFKIYNKAGKVQAKVKLDRDMLERLRDRINNGIFGSPRAQNTGQYED